MTETNYKTLELDKILEMLADECSNDKSKEMALNLRPFPDLFSVQNEIRKTTDALDMSVRYGTPNFYSIKDVSASLKRAASGGVLSLAELIQIRRVLAQTSELCRWQEQCENKDNSLANLFECLYPDNFLQKKLEAAIIDDMNLSDDASAELSSIRKKISRSGLKIRQTLDHMVKSPSVQKYLQESIITMRDGRFVLPVKTEFKGNVSGLVHDTSATGSTLFIEPMSVVEANNDIRILQGEEQDEIHRIISEFSMECADIKDKIISSYKAITELNLYFSKANLGAKMRAMTPELADDGHIILNKARHPLIDSKKVVPINFEIGNGYSSLIITGPNTGGKTVVLKTVGLLTLMTMCGLLIPCSDGSRISIYKNVLVDIGDQQSIENNLSTFSSHISRVKEILDIASNESLVLLDELGSGTDPVEGAALAVAIIERLRQFDATLINTTHYQELKMYAIDTADVENASCEFDVDTMKPTYKLVIGSPGKSNAFAISKSLGIDDDILKYAKSLVSDDNRKFEAIIDNLERTRMKLEENNTVAEKCRHDAEAMKAQLEADKERFFNDKENELDRARREAQEIVKRVQRESNSLVDELNKIRKEKDNPQFSQLAADAKRHAKSAVNKMYKDANPISESRNEGYVLPRPLKKGDRVTIPDTGRSGIVISPPDNNGNCFIQSGIMKTKIDVKKLRLAEKQNTPKQTTKKTKGGISTKGVESRMTRKITSELDIRGYAADDGIYKMDNFIDEAVMSGVTMVTIIHGRGTGVLKEAVRKHLKHNVSVKSFRKGVYGEGEDGVTIVELK